MQTKEPKTIQIQSEIVIGLTERTKNEDEFNPEKARIPHLWQRFYEQDWVNSVLQSNPKTPIYGVYSDYQSDATGFYSITAGLKSDDISSKSSFNKVSIQAGDYLMFEGKGPMSETIIQTWQAIWQYFSLNPGIVRAYVTDFEVYTGTESCAVYIGVL